MFCYLKQFVLFASLCFGVFSCGASSSYSPPASGGGGEGDSNPDGGTPPSGTGGVGLKEVYAETVYPILAQRCVGCHTPSAQEPQNPFFAQDDIDLSLEAVASKVVLDAPERSRIYLKVLQEGHNCWTTSCAEDSEEILKLITEWADKSKSDDQDDSNKTAALTFGQRQMVENVEEPVEEALSNAADATINGNFQLANDGASVNGSVVRLPANSGTFNNVGQSPSRLILDIEVEETTSFNLWSSIRSLQGNQDTIFVRIDNGNFRTWTFTGGGDAFDWQVVDDGNNNPVGFNLQPGPHRVEFRQREAGIILDQIALQPADRMNPPGEAPVEAQEALLFDLGEILGVSGSVKLAIDISIYDEFSFLLKNPRILSEMGDVRVKGLKVLINGVRDANVTTFELVEKTTTQEDFILSRAAMVAPTINGFEADSFEVEFEELELVP